MYLTERHIIKNNKELDEVCLKSKNLYNKAMYLVRQHYFNTKEYLNFFKVNKLMIDSKDEDYYSLPTNVSNQTLRLLDKNFKLFFSLLKKKKKGNYDKPVKLPKYLDKEGRHITIFNKYSVSKKSLKKGFIKLSSLSIEVPTKVKESELVEVRILPRNNHHIFEVVYEVEDKEVKVDNNRYASVDLGVNNLMTVSSNVTKPFIINGRPLKSINQYWNKEKARLQSLLKGNKRTSKRIQSITNKRNNKVLDYLHKSTRKLVNFLVSNNISTLIVGYNEEWKRNINLGKRNNQSFVNIPFYTLIKQLEYKCKLEGINFIITEESYTSKCSFLDNEEVCKHKKYLGKRIKRGLFKSSENKLINADLNGSLNILKKVVGEFEYPIEAWSTPLKITLK
uniref:Endonuclease n=1 Tax=Siphoviridae sp. ctDOT22 TaxID=2827812 RepID=A0A8S5SVG6_9CAUD|nr:MAG TPA: endonuclease [Siphoviridae sp. ctDOT22]